MPALHQLDYAQFQDGEAVAFASTPAAIRSGVWRIHYIPRQASSTLTPPTGFSLCAIDSTATLYVHKQTTLSLIWVRVLDDVGATIVQAGPITWEALDHLTITVDSLAGELTVDGPGFAETTATAAGGQWTFPDGQFYMGTDDTGTPDSIDGWLSLPYAVAGSPLPALPGQWAFNDPRHSGLLPMI